MELFWNFLQLEDKNKCVFNLAYIRDTYEGSNKDELLGHLLRSQVAAVSECVFEKLRGSGTFEFAQQSIPDKLRVSTLENEKLWFLVLFPLLLFLGQIQSSGSWDSQIQG